MPRFGKEELLGRVARAVHESGWNVIYISDQHPFVLRIYRDAETYLIRVYIWNLTHGGGARRPADEYRIQVTGINNEIGFVETGVEKTLILGWWNEGGVFAGFDVSSHRGPLGSSPSLQIREDALRQAAVNGLGTANKGNQEIAVAFRPDFVVEYVRDLEVLHGFGRSEQDQAVLTKVIASPGDLNDTVVQQVSAERQTVVATISKKLRDSSFRNRVLVAYSQRCAFCRLQLRLVDAAHIIPASQADNDATANGLALCALHHRAFDRALVTLNEDYQIILNEQKVADLKAEALDGGLAEFADRLRAIVDLPPAKPDRPNILFIQQANEYRGWSL